MLVKMRTYEMATGELVHETEVDFAKPSARPFVARHQYWAFTNGKGVQMFNAVDEKEVKHENQ